MRPVKLGDVDLGHFVAFWAEIIWDSLVIYEEKIVIVRVYGREGGEHGGREEGRRQD